MPYTKNRSLTPIFTTRDEKLHMQLKSPIAPLYSLSNVINYEKYIDEVVSVFFRELNARYVQPHRPQRTVDLGNWLQYFTFDVIGTMTFSQRYGFLDQDEDVDGMLEKIWQFFVTSAPVSCRLHLWHDQ